MNLRARYLLIIGALFAVIFYVYYPAISFAFLDGWDDPQYITENAKIQSLAPDNLAWIFTSVDMGNYAPVHILTYAIEYYFFGLDPVGYRVVSIALHFLNAALVFVIVRIISARDIISFLVALIFAAHPLQVETVAWVSQMKNLLSTFFMLISFIVFVLYRSTDRALLYWISLGIFAVALLSKISVVVLPAYMLAYDLLIHRHIKIKRLYREYIGFTLISISMIAITLIAQGAGVGVRLSHYGDSAFEMLLVPPAVWGSYIHMLLSPNKLSALYDENIILQLLIWKALVGITALLSVAAMLMRWRDSRYREQLFWGVWFFTGLLPVSHIIPMVTILNDRYVYFPMIGLFAFIITFIFNLILSSTVKYARAGTLIITTFFVLTASVYGWASKSRVWAWQDSCTLWGDAVEKYPNQAKARNNLGGCFENQNNLVQAEIEYRRAAEIDPDLFVARYNLGKIYGQMKRFDEAIHEFRIAEQVLPNDPLIHYFLGIAYKMNGEPELAIQQLQKSLLITPNKMDAVKELLDLYVAQGHHEEAESLIDEVRGRRFRNNHIEPLLQKMERKIEAKDSTGKTKTRGAVN